MLRTLGCLCGIAGSASIVVVDNASCDGTQAVVETQFPDVKLIALEANVGAHARSVGVKAAEAPYIAFCDDDCWWEADSLAIPAVGLYAPLGAPVVVTDRRSAELIKYAANVFLATKISYINEIAAICERAGADIEAVARGIGLDRRIGPTYLEPELGFGGSCLPKDVRALRATAQRVAVESPLLDAVLRVNDSQVERVAARLAYVLGGARGAKIAVLGLTFKGCIGPASAGKSMRRRIVFDMRNALDADAYTRAGFLYNSVGAARAPTRWRCNRGVTSNGAIAPRWPLA